MGMLVDTTARGKVEGRWSHLDSLYVAHYPDAVRLAWALTNDLDAARELVQEAFVRVAGRFVHRRAPNDFGSYVRRVVVNLHRSQLRRRRVERGFLGRSGRQVEASDPFEAIEQRYGLRAALQVLGARQRAAVVLRYCFDMSESQVADSLNCSVPAAKHLVARGLIRLRQELGGDVDE
jgi:RNA polymerase sigma-70 factor (sigma-E family)